MTLQMKFRIQLLIYIPQKYIEMLKVSFLFGETRSRPYTYLLRIYTLYVTHARSRRPTCETSKVSRLFDKKKNLSPLRYNSSLVS